MSKSNDISVLIVDDSDMESQFLSELLQKLDISPDVARNGNSAIELCSGAEYDIIFIDLIMYGTSGIEVLRGIQGFTYYRKHNVPIIALGGDEELSEAAEYLNMGFTNIIKKPVMFPILEAALALYLPEDRIRIVEQIHTEKEDEELSELPEWILDIDKVDTDEGIKNCATVDGYMSALKIFAGSIEVKADEIKGYFDAQDWELYTIKVHALKSSARLIGAMELSELAKELEAAGNELDISRIKMDTGRLLEMYRDFNVLLAPISGKDENIPKAEDTREPVPPQVLEDAYASMREFSESFDYELMEMVLDSLKEYRLPDADEQVVSRIRDYTLNMDWNGIKEVLSAV